jgi:Tol biopolymer transport system component/predicted Ser/Thr protein kinase
MPEPRRTEGDPSATADVPAPLQRGSRLGSYEIQDKLGAGGMGWVYRATDLRLHRTAAIKVLPAGEVSDSARRRFVREAQAASALNHPNIVTIYEVGRQHDTDYIAMEYVQGATLHELSRGAGLSLLEVARYATQIAEALCAAHEAGIVHRDLKPGNIMVTDRGLVKVLDFGLAKRTIGDDLGPSVAGPLTIAGNIVGTASYMSPEQIEGREVDSRSDIFSFGCVLYEMITGTMAFAEGSSVGTMAAVLAKEPAPIRERVPGLPRGFERIIGRCLQKRPGDRWQHMGDVKSLLQELERDLEGHASGDLPDTVTQEMPSPVRRRSWLEIGAAAAVGAIAAVGLMWWAFARPAPPAPQPALRMLTADPGLSAFPALSKDGRLLAFASDRRGEGNLDIWLHQIGSREPARLTTGEADESEPSISPDGTKVAYRSERDGGGIYVIPTLGGEPLLIAPGGRNPKFSPDGRYIAYWTGRESGYRPGSARVFVIEAGGGQAREVAAGLSAALYPLWSPAGDSLLVLGRGDPNVPLAQTLDWWLVPVNLVSRDREGMVKQTGALQYFRAAKLTALSGQINIVPLEWTEPGSRIVFAAAIGDAGNLWQIAVPSGKADAKTIERLTLGPGRQAHAASAGPRLAFADVNLNFDIWSMPVDSDRGTVRGAMSRITEMGTVEWASSITQDGKELAFISRKIGDWWVRVRDTSIGHDRTLVMGDRPLVNVRVASDGSRVFYADQPGNIYSVSLAGGSVERLCERCGTIMGASADGRRVLYEPLESEHLMMYDVASASHIKLALRPDTGTILSGGQFSPDGQWAAFHSISNKDGSARIWVTRIDTASPVPQSGWISITDGQAIERDPAWAPGGALLYYLSERDGFRCIWARRLDRATKRPAGEPFAVAHFHSARRSLARVGNQGYLTGLSVAEGRMVFSLGELTGNVWLKETPAN